LSMNAGSKATHDPSAGAVSATRSEPVSARTAVSSARPISDQTANAASVSWNGVMRRRSGLGEEADGARESGRPHVAIWQHSVVDGPKARMGAIDPCSGHRSYAVDQRFGDSGHAPESIEQMQRQGFPRQPTAASGSASVPRPSATAPDV